ncbi:hypothetical protein FXV77_10595 [Sphingobacterium phlebotomi]|uniref:Peptidase S74 domain-containing protein n=1 Tax=Sphingobacterium phlebotomi TaxID=2605433 RepID=A0A5D4H6L5_9SPHI|nr:hypothetical protein [Sphingobacterium phlebotomi]TYR36348.1 hypothetical protein FXV77_10595 [Sphingobacterium phlebotomi]
MNKKNILLFSFLFMLLMSVPLWSFGQYSMEKSFMVKFPNQEANRVCYINISPGNRLWGSIDIQLTGGYNNQLNRGSLTKRIDIVYNGQPSGYLNQSFEIVQASDPLATQWRIGDFDPVQSRIPIYHLASTGNELIVRVKILSSTAAALQNIMNGMAVSEIEEGEFDKTRSYRYLNESRIGIGTQTPEYRVDIVGSLRAHEIRVNTQKTADHVFEKGYPLMSLDSVAEFISKHGHLPEILSASEMKETPLNVGDFQIDLLQKIEELTLYMIEANKTIREQNTRIKALESKNAIE